ncbi:transposable element Tc1 transposase [Trichonephila clavipes]|nr:transposable element Tc1 transposase [Trichonephila clavipes]
MLSSWTSTHHQRKRMSKTVLFGKIESSPDNGSAGSPIHCTYVSVSERTVQKTLLDMKLHNRRSTRVTLLTKYHCQPHLQWAWEHRDWTMDKWKRVVWSDES